MPQAEQRWRPEPDGVADAWLVKALKPGVPVHCGELARALIARLAHPGTELLRDRFGKPYLSPRAFEISISHSGSWLAVAASSVPCGIDIEDASLPRPLDGAASVIMDPETFAEWREHGRAAAAFLESWTRREAIGKVAGRGLTMEIMTAPLGSVFGTADAAIHHYHIQTRPDLHLAIAAVAPQRLLRLRRLTSDLELDSKEVHVLADYELGHTQSRHARLMMEGNKIRGPTMLFEDNRHLLVQYEQTLTRIVDICKETKGQVSGSARLMATLAANALSFRNIHAQDIGDRRLAPKQKVADPGGP